MALRIGILDDDENVLFTLQAMAQTQRWQVLASTFHADAQKWFNEGRVDLLLLDYHMPHLNGMEVLKILKRINPTIPVLMLTMEENVDLAKSLLMEGADDFISKPIRLADFVSRIRVHEKLASSKSDLGWQKSDKGMSWETRRRIIDVLREMGRAASIREVTSAIGLAYSTVHRYLDYLYQEKLLNRTIIIEDRLEGKPGRPVVRYSLIRESERDISAT
jgi:DNA-binding response OmpR family regulator